jgi:regulation of enolase protein 1 (concanavalin A-like superfamily)
VSDDFNAFSLNPAVWTLFDPVGDVTFSTRGTNTSDAQLVIHLPAGEHAISTTANESARIMQPIVDSDFEMEVKFESSLTAQFQEQGLLVEGGPGHFVRADFYSDGASNRIFVGVYNGGSVSTKANLGIPTGPTQYLRINRTGNIFELSYSLNGLVFQPVVTFSESMIATAVGLFAANEGTNPEHIAVVDYFFNNAAPIIPEDGDTGVVDTVPPLIYNVSTAAASDFILVTWSTDELATGDVDFGLDTGYGLGTVTETGGATASHVVQIEGLAPDTTYHLRIRSQDLASNESSSGDIIETTTLTGGGGPGPAINVWYGLNQPAGQNGVPQEMFNLVGNVFDAEGVTALDYSLNAGPQFSLSFHADSRRLQNEGDFNAEIPYDDLLDGPNVVVITAMDGASNQSIETVTIDRSFGTRTMPYTIDWGTAPGIQDVAPVIDGKWSIVPGGLQTTEIGYDRLVGVGDLDQADVEVTVPFTVYSIDPRGFVSPANHPVVGIGLRWLGHTQNNSEQPAAGFVPLGGLIINSWNDPGDLSDQRFRALGNNGNGIGQVTSSLSLGVTYVMKVRCETNGGTTDYFAKVWPQGAPEPASWSLTTSDSGVHLRGSIMLVAQYADTIFGNVEVRDVSGGPTGPSIDVEPSDQLVLAPNPATFTVFASGTAPLLYQWQEFDGTSFVDAPGETGDTLVLSPTLFPDDGGRQFRVVVDNALGTVTSAAASLTVVETAARATADLQTLHLFDENGGSLVRDQSGVGAPLDLEIPDLGTVTWEVGGGLTLDAASLVATAGPATKINDAVSASDEITVEAWVAPFNLTQNGPARIVTISTSSSRRNVTLGQGHFGGSGALYAARLRSSDTNDNGTPALETAAGSLTTDLTHVVFTRDVSGETRIYLDGALVQIGANGGDLSPWDLAYRLAIGREFDGTNQVFLGTYHLLAIYSRALSAFEVGSNFAVGPGGEPPLPAPPSIIQDPQDTLAYAGNSATLSVVATGTPSPDYQWEEYDGVEYLPIPGATAASYTTPPLDLADDGAEFRVIATNSEGTATSAPAILTVQPAPPRVASNLIALYLFNDVPGTSVGDVSGFGTPLNLAIPDPGAVTWLPGGGLAIDSESLIASPGPATKITTSIAASNEVTLEAWVAPQNLTQNGPARIVTLSADSSNRNITLAQGRYKKSSELYALRLRTTTTNDNGTPAVETNAGTLTTNLTHVVFTRDAAGNARLYLDGTLVESDIRDGTLATWDASYRLAIGREFDGTNQVFLGTYRLVAFYDRALSAAEVLQNFAVGPVGTP